tara:strand:- start:26 stop:433 length:408 start_codon:yes stop_codon:yes gene_type:complete
MTRVKKNCAACYEIIEVRLADHKRGWGKFCDKECAATYKNGNRPESVNKKFAKHSPWAKRKLKERADLYGGNLPPKAPSIKEQLGKKVKVKPIYHSPSTCRDCGTRINGPGYCDDCWAIRDALESLEAGWDDHKQ